MTLPAPAQLERICKGLAALDAIVSEDWGSRYYSFNSKWAPGERMASMRNGSGDDWFLLFTPAGTFLKGFWHEHPRENVKGIYTGIPKGLEAALTEPAFDMEAVTYGGFHDGKAWTLRGNAKPMKDELAILSGDPEVYRKYAEGIFERELPVKAIAHVLEGKKPTTAILEQLSSERTLEDLAGDLKEIGY